MSGSVIEIEGTLQADGRLILDKTPALPPGRVRVALQAIGHVGAAANDVISVLQEIRAAQSARQHIARTKEEIDAAINTMRADDEGRMQAIERLHDESQRRRSGNPS